MFSFFLGEYLGVEFLSHIYLLLWECLFKCLGFLKIVLFAFLLLNCRISLYILDRNSLIDICAVNIETNFCPLGITENLGIVMASVHNQNKNNGLYAKM